MRLGWPTLPAATRWIFDIPIFGGMDAAVADQPAPDLEFQILSIDIEGDAASVKVAEPPSGPRTSSTSSS